MNSKPVSSSFRDPSGFLFYRDNVLYRQVNQTYRLHYEHLHQSGLYKALIDARLLVPHDESDIQPCTAGSFKVIKPQTIPFISYPYEWCFSQLKDAALTTIEIQKKALEHNMSLKDASAYNIQFLNSRPVLIDTLSFELYRKDEPWVAYRQFCQHFLAPLALMSLTDIRLQQLLRVYIDGIPLDLAAHLLPMKTYGRFSLLSHIHLHARSQKKYADQAVKVNSRKMSMFAMKALVDSLETAIKKLCWQPYGTEWAEYYDQTNYTEQSFELKRSLVANMLDAAGPSSVWDLGANTGVFSRIASSRGIPTVAFDIDPAAVEKNYLDCVRDNEGGLLPLVLDLTNPSSAIGWAGQERQSIAQRGPADAVLALALIHHLAITNNVPLIKIAEFLHSLCSHLIIEFVPKSDSQVQRLLATREDIFDRYDREHFEQEFREYFILKKCVNIDGSQRTLCLMEGKILKLNC